jgi:serine phosphatase RsbU (regulator of sigma subunit)
MEIDFDIMSVLNSAQSKGTARALAVAVPTISCDQSNAQVLEVFSLNRELISLPVLEEERPIGMISRNIFMSQMSKPYYRELYEKKTCIAFMDKNPLIVQADTCVETLAALAVKSGDKTLADGFLIIEDDQFLGLGSGLNLMRMMVNLQKEKNLQVMQSIDYASTIQRAMMSTSLKAMSATLNDACLIWEPRDVVGGDFYHFERFNDGWFAAVADCTGHGVPGAFLTLIASSLLSQGLRKLGPKDPAMLMSEVNRGMKLALGQFADQNRLSESDDGMDAAFFWFNDVTSELTCANAKAPLFILMPDQDEIQTVEGKRVGIGYVDTPAEMCWDNKTLTLTNDAVVLSATDGIIDQIGGMKNIAFGKQRLRDYLFRHRDMPMEKFGQLLMLEQKTYQGLHRRRDDLTVFGFRLNASNQRQSAL